MKGGARASVATELHIIVCLAWFNNEGETSSPVTLRPSPVLCMAWLRLRAGFKPTRPSWPRFV